MNLFLKTLGYKNKFRGTTANVFSRCRVYRLFAVFPFLWSRNPMLIGFGFFVCRKTKKGYVK